LWRMPRFPILDRSREWKGDVMPTNAIAESGALRGQVSRLGFEGFLAIRLREAATARISDARAAIPRLARPASPCCSSARSGAGARSRPQCLDACWLGEPSQHPMWPHSTEGEATNLSVTPGIPPPAATPATCGHAKLVREPTSEPIVRGQLADYWSPKRFRGRCWREG